MFSYSSLTSSVSTLKCQTRKKGQNLLSSPAFSLSVMVLWQTIKWCTDSVHSGWLNRTFWQIWLAKALQDKTPLCLWLSKTKKYVEQNISIVFFAVLTDKISDYIEFGLKGVWLPNILVNLNDIIYFTPHVQPWWRSQNLSVFKIFDLYLVSPPSS